MRRARPLWLILGLVLLLALAGGVWFAITAGRFQRQIEAIRISEVDLSQVADGVYTGAEETVLVKVEVRVTVRNGRITAIDLLRHEHGQGYGAEAVPGKVIAAQSLLVDTVSGATYSSKVILKAIANALTMP